MRWIRKISRMGRMTTLNMLLNLFFLIKMSECLYVYLIYVC